MWNFIKNMKARRMNKIVDEVTGLVEEKMDFLFDDFASKMNAALSNLSINYDELARYVDHGDIAYNMDASDVAEYIEVDAYDIAQNFDTYTIASEIDVDDIAQNIDLEHVATYINLDDIELNIRSEIEETKDEIIAEVTTMIEDAVAEVESSIDQLTVTRG